MERISRPSASSFVRTSASISSPTFTSSCGLTERRIEKAADSGEPVPGAVIEVVKGGLILDLGVRGFLPASLVDIRR
ncbi:MAG TPA: S1 RNA-binding domain-containing protein, partial [Gaiellaceae bacterium]|nr:S1 RNA-binding domain-containing protein [Gaiellaceae bacterium]